MADERNDVIVPTDEELMDLAEEIKQAARKRIRGHQNRIPDEYGGGDLDSIDAEKAEVDWIPGKFQEFLYPYPWDFTDKLNAIDEIAAKLGTGVKDHVYATGDLEAIDTAKGYMQDWDGALASNFTRYLEDFPAIARNQGRIMCVLHDSLQGMRDIYAEARRNLKKTGKDALTAIEKADGMDGNGMKALLTVLSTAFAVGSAALGGPAAGITAAVVAGGIATGGNEIEDKEYPLAAAFPDDVVDNLKEALDQLEEDIAEKEDELIDQMMKAANEIHEHLGVQVFTDILTAGSTGTPITPSYPDTVRTALDDPSKLDDGFTQLV